MNNKPSVQGVIAATAVSAVKVIGRRHVILVNVGAKTAFIRLNDATATVSDFPLLSGASITLDSSEGSEIYSVVTICTGAEATTVNYLAFN
jgi:hypothetical protein